MAELTTLRKELAELRALVGSRLAQSSLNAHHPRAQLLPRASRVDSAPQIWRDDGIIQHREGKPCESWAAAMAASWRLASRARSLDSRPG